MPKGSRTQIRPTEYLLERTTILIVDDERGPRESLRMILSPAHKVIVASCGTEALEILRSTRVDLVTIDLNMPGMKGDELMRTIRQEFPRTEIIVITGCGSVETAVEGIRYGISDYISKPFDVVQVSSAVSRALWRLRSRMRLVDFLEGIGAVLGKDRDARVLLGDLERDTDLQERLASILQEPALSPGSPGATERSEQTVEFLEVLAQTIESRDQHLRGHARRVGFYAGVLIDRLEPDAEEREHARIASFLHDLGKVGMNDEALSAQERGTAASAGDEEHVEIGERLVMPLGFSTAISSAIRHHHEHWDGRGYPDGLRGEEIPRVSRVIAVVDSFDRMTAGRPGKDTVGVEVALARLAKLAGSELDPDLVSEFTSMVETGGCDPEAVLAGDAGGH